MNPCENIGDARERSDLLRRLDGFRELDLGASLQRVGGMVEVYEQSLDIVVRRLPGVIQKLGDYLGQGDMKSFAIDVHGVKGSLGNIGATELVEQAQELETRSKGGDLEYCQRRAPLFLEELRGLHARLSRVLDEANVAGGDQKMPGSVEEMKRKLSVTRSLLKSFLDVEAADIVREMLKFDYGPDLNLQLRQLMNFILEFDPDNAVALIDRLD